MEPPRRQSGSGGLEAFAAQLAKRLAGENADGNLVFSPLTIYTALGLLAAGARGNTLDEILRVLGARSRAELEGFVSRLAGDALRDRSVSGGPGVAFACGVWTDLTHALKPAYRDAVVGTYKAEARAMDFRNDPEGSRERINAWAAEATRDLIDSVLPPGSIRQTTDVVLGNAIYFKGHWEQPFEERHTVQRPFHRLDGGLVVDVDVPFMQSREPQLVAVHRGFKVLKLRYKMASSWDEHVAPSYGQCYAPGRVDPPPAQFHPIHLADPPYRTDPHGSLGTLRLPQQFQHGVNKFAPYYSTPAPPCSYNSNGGHAHERAPGPSYSFPPAPPFSYTSNGGHGHERAPVPSYSFPPAPPFSSHVAPYAHPNSLGPSPFSSHVAPSAGSNSSGRVVAPPPPFRSNVPAMHAAPPFARTDAPGHVDDPIRAAYAGGGTGTSTQFSMCIFLPDARDGLWSLVDEIASRPGFLREHLPTRKIALREFRVPRFKLSFHDSVVPVLQKLGLLSPFCPGAADLSDMLEGSCSNFVEDVVHKATIEVNEEGTEAAAVTMIMLFQSALPPSPLVDFVADHPFAYFVVEEASGAVVFAGHVLDPSKE